MFLGFLLPVCLGIFVFDLLRRLKPALDLREIILIEAILLGVFVVATTEILSPFHALTSWVILCWWTAACFAVHHYRTRFPRAEPLNLASRGSSFFRESTWDMLGMLLVIVIFTTTLLLIGLFATPNNYDSMTYHLARVAHWQQDQSIAFYGTNIPRQNFMPPWAEWLMFHLILLQGDDHLVNLVQGFSYIGCMIAASLITELLGGTRRDGIFAAFFVATLPAATFEATSTQNDLVMSFWLLCCVYACVKLWSRPDWLGASIFGASLGLGVLTKTVVMIFGLPLGLWAAWALTRHGLRKNLSPLALIAVIALTLNAGHFTRNLLTSGHLLGPDKRDGAGDYYRNDIHTPRAIFSNVLRNASLHFNIFHEKAGAEKLVINILQDLGIDPQDARTTSSGADFSIWEGGEDGAPMPFHLALIALTFIALLWNYRRFSLLPIALACGVALGALLFCIILKWQPFHARLHLPLFIMSAPCAALVLGRLFWRWFSLLVVILFLVTSIPNVFLYGPRAAVGPYSVFLTSDDFQQLFRQPQLASPYLEAKQILEDDKVQDVGLIWKQDDWEYPFLVSHHEPPPWRADHVLIENDYTPLETTQVPDALLCTRPGFGDVITVHGRSFRLFRGYVDQDKNLILSIYLPDSGAQSAPP